MAKTYELLRPLRDEITDITYMHSGARTRANCFLAPKHTFTYTVMLAHIYYEQQSYQSL